MAARVLLVLVWLLAQVAAAAALTVTRGPYLQLGSSSGVVVRWRTDVASDSRVRYGDDPAALDATAGGDAATTEHVVPLTDLAPDTRYFYSVGTTAGALAGGDASYTFRTAPARGTGRPLRIWALGDSGTGGSGARAVRDAYVTFAGASPADLWFLLGDNAYDTGTDAEYQRGVFDTYPLQLRGMVLWPTLGNHDGASADSASQSGPYYDIFTLPTQGEAGGVASGTEAYYAFDYGDLHVVSLESYETSRAADGAMLRWLADDLAATQAGWIIAFWHHPPYSKGSHDSDADIESRQMRANALPLLEAAGVDLVLTGHSHAYERSVLLDGHYGASATLTGAMIRDGGDGSVDGDGAYRKLLPAPTAHGGAVYVVNGSGAKLGGGSLDHPVMITSLNELGSLVIDIDGPALQARFVSSSGAVRDAFSIVKQTPTATATATPSASRTPTLTASPTATSPPPPHLDAIAAPLLLGATNMLSGSDFSPGAVVMLFVATAGGTRAYGPYTPVARSATALGLALPASIAPGNGYASVVVVNADRGYASSNARAQLLLGSAAAGLPALRAVDGVPLASADTGAPTAWVPTVLAPGAVVTIAGSGFSQPLVNLFTGAGNRGPLAPLAGATADAFRITLPADLPTGPGSLQVVNAPYVGSVVSNAASVVLGARLDIAAISQHGSQITVSGSGFCAQTVLNFFNRQGAGAVNLGGLAAGGQARLPLTSVTATHLTFAVPAGAVAGPSFLQALNPPFIAWTATGNDADGAFVLAAP